MACAPTEQVGFAPDLKRKQLIAGHARHSFRFYRSLALVSAAQVQAPNQLPVRCLEEAPELSKHYVVNDCPFGSRYSLFVRSV